MSAARLHDSRLVRLFCVGAGVVALALGVVGIVVPVLPTTPFVLLAAACFARSSVRLHDAMLAHRIAGPIIHEWQTHRAMPRKVKRVAYGLMLLSFGIDCCWPWLAWCCCFSFGACRCGRSRRRRQIPFSINPIT